MDKYFKYVLDKDSKYPRCFEIQEVNAKPPAEKMVYVCTRSLYGNSLWGQVERCGWIDISNLEPFNPKKKRDREILEQLDKVEKEAIKRSQIMFDMLKSQRDIKNK